MILEWFKLLEIIFKEGYDYNSPMIVTLQESGSGGNRIWNLNGEVVEKKLSWDDIKNRLNDSNDPLTFNLCDAWWIWN